MACFNTMWIADDLVVLMMEVYMEFSYGPGEWLMVPCYNIITETSSS